MQKQQNITNNLAPNMNVPDGTAWSITKIAKHSGEVTGYELSNGQIISKEQAINMAKQGQIMGVTVAVNQGAEYLRSLPDQTEGNNLSSLPVIHQ